ncbi:MAG: 30S ribosomal protein S6 [Prolixibacteraceae bacterium]|nr:30S ribosomal protein S6 [Prolixibacteraceae bacterium]
MLNQYESVFIVTPVLSDAQFREVVGKFNGIITANGGEILNDEDWGLKKLAYPIQKKTTGFYHLVEFKAEASFIEKLETEYRRDERIIRFLSFRLDKHAVEYSEKRRNKVKAKAEEK